MGIRVAAIQPAEHAAWVAAQPYVPYVLTPEWASTKSADEGCMIGFFDGDRMVGIALVLSLPTFAGRLAQLPDGPFVPWGEVDADALLAALEEWARAAGFLSVRVSPFVEWRRFSSEALKALLASGHDENLRAAPATSTDPVISALIATMAARGYHVAPELDTALAQNTMNFFVDVDRPLEAVQADLNQMYRRNIRKAEKAGVVVREGDAADLPTFHALYSASARREHFFEHDLAYFQLQWRVFGEDPERCHVFLAELADGTPLAGGVCIQVGNHVWYTCGGSTDTHREARAVNALQWAMIRSAHEHGATVYDAGGVWPLINGDTRGLLQFKTALGGYVVQSPDERTKVLRPVREKAFRLAGRARALAARVR